MSNTMTAFAFSALALGSAAVAHADNGVEFTPLGPGGVQWTVSVPAYGTPFNYGRRLANGYDVPEATTQRAGCFVISPWLPVGHGDGTGLFLPDFYGTWEGVIFPRTSPSAPVLNLQVEIMAANGQVSTARQTLTSAFYDLQAVYFPTPDSVVYWGDLDNTATNIRALQGFSVHRDDQIRVSLCDLAAISSLTVRHLIVQTVPFDR